MSNLKPSEVPSFLDSYIEDKLILSSLETTDVALSLSKRKRWLLPATVGHMIKTGRFNEAEPAVSLLERHKLKRRANCISFVSNHGRIQHLVPKQKRYFSFKLNNTGAVQSNRQKKHQKVKNETNKPASKNTKNRLKGFVKTVEAFTVERSRTFEDGNNSLMSSVPEYRLEVFSPCPPTCSLAYNPKYTNIHMEFDEQGRMELKSEKRVTKKGGRHRKRFTLKDLEMYDPDIVPSDTEEFWDDGVRKFEIHEVSNDENNVRYETFEDSLEANIQPSLEEYNNDSHDNASHVEENENIIAILVAQAEKARSLCGNSQPRRKRKQSSKSFADQSPETNSNEKPHIVYTNERNPRLGQKNKRPMKASVATNNHVTLHSAKVILKSTEVTPENLRVKYGRLYAEAESEPRRFMIDVTEDIQNLLCPYRNTDKSAVYTSFLVFVHDGAYDEGLDTYRVIFNSNCCQRTEVFKDCLPFDETTFEEIMNRVASLVLDIKEQQKLHLNTDLSCRNASILLMKIVNDHFKYSVKTFRSSDEIRRVSQTEVMQESVDFSRSLESIAKSLDCEIYCDICYENINPTQTWDKCGTKLSKCSHNFCDVCWRSHFRAKLKNGSMKMTCPGYDCDQAVGPVTLLSLLHVSDVSKLFQRMCEEEVDSSSNSKWCPNRDCGRVIKLDIERSTNEMSLDVTCSCGQEFCFSCLSNPHWPATCEQAEKYTEKIHKVEILAKNGPSSDDTSKISSHPSTRNKTEVLEVEGRLCPKCSKFIDKNGGCANMYCKCGHMFCWKCMKSLTDHKECLPNTSAVLESTLKLKVTHLIIPTHFSLYSETTNNPKEGGSRKKRTLYKKAMHERQEVHDIKYQREIKEMEKQIVYVSQKDLHLKREIMSICGREDDNMDAASLTLFPIGSHVSKFLRSCCEIKGALHHVAEFTFVLLQDAPDSPDRRRTLRLANDLSDYCILMKSILETGHRQDVLTAVRRLADIQMWAKRALNVLLVTVGKLRG